MHVTAVALTHFQSQSFWLLLEIDFPKKSGSEESATVSLTGGVRTSADLLHEVVISFLHQWMPLLQGVLSFDELHEFQSDSDVFSTFRQRETPCSLSVSDAI